jgi:hypothetical protein
LVVKEQQKGVHLAQFDIGLGRIDRTYRLFKHGGPGSDDARLEFDPAVLGYSLRPSFGKP